MRQIRQINHAQMNLHKRELDKNCKRKQVFELMWKISSVPSSVK